MSKRRFTKEQARSALLLAGRQMLAEVGLSGGVGRVTLAEAINRSGVPRPSAYRVFGDTDLDPQRAFHEELIVDITSVGPAFDIALLAEPVHHILAQVEDLGADATADDLTKYLRELIRVAAIGVSHEHFTDTPVGVYLSVLASTVAGERNPRVEAAARQAEEGILNSAIPFIRESLTSFGLRMRDGWTYFDFTGTLLTAILGALLTARVSPVSAELDLPTGQGDATQPWTPLGTVMLGIVWQATEPDPRMVVSAQPSRWFG